MKKAGPVAFALLAFTLLLVTRLAASDDPGSPPGPRVTPAADLSSSIVKVTLRTGEKVSGRLAGLDDESLYLARPGGELRIARAEIAGVELPIPRSRRHGLIDGVVAGIALGWVAGSLVEHNLYEAPGASLLTEAFGGLACGWLGSRGDTGPARRTFPLAGRPERDEAAWARLRRFVRNERSASRVHLAFSGGFPPNPVGRSVKDAWKNQGWNSTYLHDRLDPFRRVRLSFSLRPGIEIGAVWARLSEPDFQAFTRERRGPLVRSSNADFRYRAGAGFLAAVFRPWSGEPAETWRVALGCGLGPVRQSARVAGVSFDEDPDTGCAIGAGDQVIRECRRTALGAYAFAEAGISLAPRLTLGLSWDLVRYPRLPALDTTGLLFPSPRFPARVRATLGMSVEYGF